VRACSKCHEPTTEVEMVPDKNYCRPCLRKRERDWYRRNPSKRKAKVAANVTRMRARRMVLLSEFKSRPCLDCGNTYPPYVMDFDHTRGEKVSEVGVLVTRGASVSRILAEIDKCDIVCANCHRIRTHTRREERKRARLVQQQDARPITEKSGCESLAAYHPSE